MPPSQRHPRHCSAIPDVVGSTRRRDAATPTAVLRTASRQLHPRISTRAATERKTPMPPPSKPLLDGYRTRHDVPPDARFARTAVYSTALHTMSSHVARTVWHACKMPPPWSIKGGAVPWPQGGNGQHSLARFPPSPRYWHLASTKPQGPGDSTSSPASLVALLCKHHGAASGWQRGGAGPGERPRPRPDPRFLIPAPAPKPQSGRKLAPAPTPSDPRTPTGLRGDQPPSK
jgi:hypothetical protein